MSKVRLVSDQILMQLLDRRPEELRAIRVFLPQIWPDHLRVGGIYLADAKCFKDGAELLKLPTRSPDLQAISQAVSQ